MILKVIRAEILIIVLFSPFFFRSWIREFGTSAHGIEAVHLYLTKPPGDCHCVVRDHDLAPG